MAAMPCASGTSPVHQAQAHNPKSHPHSFWTGHTCVLEARRVAPPHLLLLVRKGAAGPVVVVATAAELYLQAERRSGRATWGDGPGRSWAMCAGFCVASPRHIKQHASSLALSLRRPNNVSRAPFTR
jgi:hypothetical protein